MYRRSAREAKANFAGTRYELKREHSELILAVARGENVETALERYHHQDWDNLKAAIQQILAGEKDVDKLWDLLDLEDSMIVYAILEGIAEPDSLKWFEEQ